jgi:hypothetical protein
VNATSSGMPANVDGAGNPAPLTRAEVIRWWEMRRIPYNIALLVIGVAALYFATWVWKGARPDVTFDAWPLAAALH